MVHLGNNVARLRGFRRVTQKQLADKLDMKQQEYSRLENKPVIDDDLLELISKALDFPVDLIKQLDTASVVNNNQQGGNAGNIFYQSESSDHVIELYEKIIKDKDEIIRMKDEVIDLFKKQQKAS
jgi:transcriptional regulator with XRE-family HTH domain